MYTKRQNFSVYISVSNVTANLNIVQRIAVFMHFVLLLIESCLFLEVSQKIQKQTVLLSITCLHIMSQRKCKNALLKRKSMSNDRQIFVVLIFGHKATIPYFLWELQLI